MNSDLGSSLGKEITRPPFRDLIIVTQYYAPEPGAPQIRLRALAKELGLLGVRVRVITGMPNYPVGRIMDGYRWKLTMRDEVDCTPVRRVWLYPAAGRRTIGRLLNYLSFTLMASLAMALSRRTDLVFIEAQPITLAIPAWITKVIRGIPYIYNTPDLQVEHAEEAGWIRLRPLVKWAANLESFLMRQALSVTTVTHAFIEHFIRTRDVPAHRLSFLPNGADTTRLRPLPRDEGYAQLMGVGSRKVFTYAGTHAHYQGLEIIVQAAQQLRHRDDIVLLMVGKGPVRQELIKAAKSLKLTNIIFGDSPFEEMHQLMSITYASLVVLRDLPASQKMRLSKVIPPLACGVPVLYAGRGESAEMIERTQCGISLEPERPDLLARAIEQLADNPQRRSHMGWRGRKLAEREFSWDFIVKDWLRQISEIMSGAGSTISGFSLEEKGVMKISQHAP